jgi:hypothetical protein
MSSIVMPVLTTIIIITHTTHNIEIRNTLNGTPHPNQNAIHLPQRSNPSIKEKP